MTFTTTAAAETAAHDDMFDTEETCTAGSGLGFEDRPHRYLQVEWVGGWASLARAAGFETCRQDTPAFHKLSPTCKAPAPVA